MENYRKLWNITENYPRITFRVTFGITFSDLHTFVSFLRARK